MNRLGKRDVEALLDRFDDDPIGALETALRMVLDEPELEWSELVAAAPLDRGVRLALLARDNAALDRLVRDLNERRTL